MTAATPLQHLARCLPHIFGSALAIREFVQVSQVQITPKSIERARKALCKLESVWLVNPLHASVLWFAYVRSRMADAREVALVFAKRDVLTKWLSRRGADLVVITRAGQSLLDAANATWHQCTPTTDLTHRRVESIAQDVDARVCRLQQQRERLTPTPEQLALKAARKARRKAKRTPKRQAA